MAYKKLNQKLISFTRNSPAFDSVKQDMESGWNIVSLIKNDNYFVGIMEQADKSIANDLQSVFIPPKKRIKISSR